VQLVLLLLLRLLLLLLLGMRSVALGRKCLHFLLLSLRIVLTCHHG
jgi:hypothetical protein